MKKIFLTTLAGAAVLALNATEIKAESEKEKCYGVAAKGKNDCAGNGHSCQGQSTKDADPGDWIMISKGLCDRLMNGHVKK